MNKLFIDNELVIIKNGPFQAYSQYYSGLQIRFYHGKPLPVETPRSL